MSLNRSNSLKFLKAEYHIAANSESFGDSFINCAKHSINSDNRIISGLKIFSFILLQSWRKSKNEIKQLKQSVEGLQKSNAQTEKQLRVYSSLLKLEQNRTQELTYQLKRTLDNLKRKTVSCKNFSKTLCNLKNSQALLEQELKKTYEESDALNEILMQTKKQLFRSMMEQRNLHTQLCKEQRAVKSLENEKKFLITEICSLNTQHNRVKENLIKELKDKDSELIAAKNLLGKFYVQKNYKFYETNEKDFATAKDYTSQLSALHLTDIRVQPYKSICERLGLFWTQFTRYPKYTLNCAHVLSYCILPAVPVPKQYQQRSK